MKHPSLALEKISEHLQELNPIPLFGNAPPLNWEELSLKVAKEFGVDDFSIQLKAQKWETSEEIQKFVKENKIALNAVKLSPMATSLFWIMTKTDRDKFIASMFSEKPKKKVFSSSVLQEGYYHFLILHALNALQSLDPIEQMTLQLENKEEIPEESGICMEIEISFGNCTVWGKLIILRSFQKDWVQHFAAFPPPYFQNELSKKIPVDLGIQVGSILLSRKEWENLSPGDLLIPDKMEEISESHSAILAFKEIPLFQARTLENHIEITQFAFNVEEPMQESKNPEEDTLSNQLNFAEKEAKALQDIPLQIHIEIGRIQMTLNELMNLSPGNTLKLPSYADKKVMLTYHGEKVGMAELVYLGETLGLKILEI